MSPFRKSSANSELVIIALTMSTVAGNGSHSSHLRVLNLVALGIKETIDVDYGSPMLEVVQ